MKTGDLLLFSSGEYSDYSPIALTRVLKDFKTAAVLEEYLTKFPEQRPNYRAQHTQFLAYLSSEGYVEDLPHTEWNVGGYSTFDGGLDDE